MNATTTSTPPRTSGVSREHRSSDIFHTFCLNPPSLWRRLRKLHPRVDDAFADRARAIALVSPLMAPLHAAERLLYGRTIARAGLPHPPIFIVGHWRSGTTLLHNLLTRDPQFGFVSLFQTLTPGAFLIGQRTLQPLLALRAPNTRPMDNVKIRMHYPSEEEFALAHLCPQSPYLGWYFPSDWTSLFSRYGLMEGISAEDRREWAAAYRELLVKADIACAGRQLVLKNPINTARIGALLEVFPGAKFIHIHRNPYHVYRATLHLFRQVLKTITLQEVSEAQIQEWVLSFYPRMMQAYRDQRGLIPPGDHAEVRYDDLVADPLAELERLYGELGLSGWAEARPHIERLAKPRAPHQPNEYADAPEFAKLVEQHWACAFEHLGYERRGALLHA